MVSSADGGTSQPVSDTLNRSHMVYNLQVTDNRSTPPPPVNHDYEDDIHLEIQVPPAISAIRTERLYQQQQQQQQRLSAPGDGHRLVMQSHWK